MELFEEAEKLGVPDIHISREEWERDYAGSYSILALDGSDVDKILAAENIIKIYLILEARKTARRQRVFGKVHFDVTENESGQKHMVCWMVFGEQFSVSYAESDFDIEEEQLKVIAWHDEICRDLINGGFEVEEFDFDQYNVDNIEEETGE